MMPWYVVFPTDEGGRRPWWARALRADHTHCWAMQPLGEAHTLTVDAKGLAMQVQVHPVPLPAMLATCLAARAWVVAYLVPPGPDRPRLRGPFTCVEALKALLRITAWWVVTPHQFKRWLHRHGGVAVLSAQPARQPA